MELFTRKSYGPIAVKGGSAGIPQEFLTLPWSTVKGANIIVAAADDVDTNPAVVGTLRPELMLLSEVTLFGIIQGYVTPLKCQVISGKLGPMDYLLPWEAGWESISFRQRLMSGGKPLTGVGSTAAQQAALVTLSLNVYVMPRGGYKEVTNG